MQIEAGKSYVSRKGVVIGPMEPVKSAFHFPYKWLCPTTGTTYKDNGDHCGDSPCEDDLVAEWTGGTVQSSPDTVKVFTHAEWDKLLDKTIEEIRKLSMQKGGEYAGDVDRLANFRRNGERLGLPMETVWAVYAGKHWDALQQYIQDARVGKVRQRMEPIEGRVDDLLVYLLLFKAMLAEAAQRP